MADRALANPHPPRRGLALHWQILIGLVVGATAGLVAGHFCTPAPDGTPHAGLAAFTRYVAEPLGQIFLRLIFMVVLPLVFCALVLGVASLGNPAQLGRVGLKTLGLTLVLSALSVVIGVGLANVVQPGAQLSAQQRHDLRARYGGESEKALTAARAAKPLRDTLLDIIPRNPLQEMVGALDGSSRGGGMLAVMFFALVFGLAATAVGPAAQPLLAVLEATYAVVLKIVGFAMCLAPLGVAGLAFALTAHLGLDVVRMLLAYMFTVLGGLSLQVLVVYTLVVWLIARLNPLTFFQRISDAALTAFATSSSNATLPTTLRVAQEELGIGRDVSGFVLTVGATGNQNGTALYEGVTVLFLAQVFGVQLDFVQQITVVLLSILAGVGTAGVPGGSLPLVVMVLQTVRVPPEGIAIILGVDRLLDMCRTTLNVVGDLVIAVCIGHTGTAASAAGPA